MRNSQVSSLLLIFCKWWSGINLDVPACDTVVLAMLGTGCLCCFGQTFEFVFNSEVVDSMLFMREGFFPKARPLFGKAGRGEHRSILGLLRQLFWWTFIFLCVRLLFLPAVLVCFYLKWWFCLKFNRLYLTNSFYWQNSTNSFFVLTDI